MIYLNPNSWLVRWYLWSAEFLDYCGTSYRKEDFRKNLLESGTNRCDFIKTVLIKAPIALLFTYGSYAALIWVLLYHPYNLAGWKGPATVGAIPITILCIILVVRIVAQPKVAESIGTVAGMAVSPIVKTANITTLVWGHLKDKYCPKISFKSEVHTDVQPKI